MKKHHHHAKKTALAAMVALALSSTGVFAAEGMPTGAQVNGGTVEDWGAHSIVNNGINPESNSTIRISANTNISWQNFDILSGKSLTFQGVSGGHYVFNTVRGNSPSGIYGSLTADNVNIILRNPSGITIGDGARLQALNAGSMLLSALNNNAISSGGVVNIGGGTNPVVITGDVTVLGNTVNVTDSITFSGETALKLLAGNGFENNVLTAAKDNKVNVNGNISSDGNVVLAGGAITVNGGNIDLGDKSAYLLAGNEINVNKILGSSGDVITKADAGNSISISNATIKAGNVHVAGYEGALTGSTITTTSGEPNIVTGSVIEKNGSDFGRKAVAGVTWGALTRSESTTVTEYPDAFIESDLPTDGQVVKGSVEYDGGTYAVDRDGKLNPMDGETITVAASGNETMNHSIINWETFVLGKDRSLAFNTANGALLNRVTGSYESWLKGSLTHTGEYPLLLVNPKGIHIYEGATIEASNLILSGLTMTENAFTTFAESGAAAFGTGTAGDITVDRNVNFSNSRADLALVGKNVKVGENSLSANELKVDATDTATLTGLTYNGKLNGNSLLDSNVGNLTLSGGSYKGETNLKGTIVNMNGTALSGGNVTVNGDTVNMTDSTFNGGGAYDLMLAGTGSNGKVTVENSALTAVKELSLTGETVEAKDTGSTAGTWSSESFTLGKGGSAANSTTIKNIKLRVTGDGGPAIGSDSDVSLVMDKAEISAPKIDISPSSLTLKGGSVLDSDSTVNINTGSGSVAMSENSNIKAAGGLDIAAEDVTVNKSDVTAAGDINIKGKTIIADGGASSASIIESTEGDILLASGNKDESVYTTDAGSSINLRNTTLKGNVVTALAQNTTIQNGIINANTLQAAEAKTLNDSNWNVTFDYAGTDEHSLSLENTTVRNLAGTDAIGTVRLAGSNVSFGGGSGTDLDAASFKAASLEVASDNDITVSAGKVDITGNGGLSLNGKSVTVNGTVSAKTISVTATENNVVLDKNSALLASTVPAERASIAINADSGSINANGSISVKDANEDKIGSVALSAKNVTIGDADGKGKVEAEELTVTAGESLALQRAVVDVTDDLTLSSKAVSVDRSSVGTAGNLTVSGTAGTVNVRNSNISASNVTVNTTGANDVTLTEASLTVANNIAVTSGKAIQVTGDLAAGGNIRLDAAAASSNESGSKAINASANMTAGTDISLNATAGEVSSSGRLTATNGNITLDSANDSKISATGALNAVKGTITLGHNEEENKTGTVKIGSASGSRTTVTAEKLHVNAADEIAVQNTNVTVTGAEGLALTSEAVTAANSTLASSRNIDIAANSAISASSAMTATGDISLTTTAGEVSSSGNLTAGGDITLNSANGSNISATGDLKAESGTITLGNASEGSATRTVEIGSATVTAKTLDINAVDNIDVQNSTVDVTDNLSLVSKKIAINTDTITTGGSFAINGTEDGDNPSVGIAGSTLRGTGITVNGKGISVSDTSTLTATSGGITAASTGENDIALTNAVLKAEHETNGNIEITSGKAIQANGGSMTAGTGISLNATAGEVSSSGRLTATNGDITLDSANDSKISATGALNAVKGTITLGHNEEENKTGTVKIGSASGSRTTVTAEKLHVNATDEIAVQNTNVTVTDDEGLALTSEAVTAANSTLASSRNIDIAANFAISASSDMNAAGNISLTTTAGEVSSSGNLTAGGDITLSNTDGSKISVTGDLIATNGTITLSNASEGSETGTVEIGPATGGKKALTARTLSINAIDKIDVKNSDVSVTDELSLVSKEVDVNNSKIVSEGSLAIKGTEDVANPSVTIIGSTLQGVSLNVEGKGMNIDGSSLMATTNGITVKSTGENIISLNTSDLNATAENAGNITVDSGKNIEIGNTRMDAGNDIAITAAAATDASYNMAIDASAGGDLTAGNDIALTAATGQLRYAGSLNAGNNINLKAVDGDVDAAGSVSAGKDVSFAGKNGVNSTADITATTGDAKLISSAGNLTASGNLNVGGNVEYRAATGVNVKSYTEAGSGNVKLSTNTGGVTYYGTIEAKDISFTANAGEVKLEGGTLTASDGNILLDSADGSKITAAGNMFADKGNITLGHSASGGNNGTGTVEVGANSWRSADIRAMQFDVNAANVLNVKNVNVTITGGNGIALASDVLNIDNARLEANYGNIDISFNGYNSNISNYNFNGVRLTANDTAEGSGKIKITSSEAIKTHNATFTANGDVNLDASGGGYINTEYTDITSSHGDIRIESAGVYADNDDNIGIKTHGKLEAGEGDIYLGAATGDIKVLGSIYNNHSVEAKNINIEAGNGDVYLDNVIEAGEVQLKANTVNVGADDDYDSNSRWISAGTLSITAPEAINVQKTAVNVMNDLSLSSEAVAVANADVRTAGDLAITSTASGVSLLDTALAANSTDTSKGNISINSAGHAVVENGSMSASNGIGVDASGAVTSSSDMVAGAGIELKAAAGGVTSSGAITASNGNIIMDSADGSAISVIGTLNAQNGTGTVTLGHAGNNATSNVAIGTDDATGHVDAKTLLVNATENIDIVKATIDVESALTLDSKTTSVTEASIETDGALTLNSTSGAANIAGSMLAGASIGVSGQEIGVDDNSALAAASGGIALNSTEAIVSSGNMTAGTGIELRAETGAVSSSGNLTAGNGNITMDSANGSAITVTGTLTAKNGTGTVTLGHAGGNATGNVAIGTDDATGQVEAKSLIVNATDNIGINKATVDVGNALTLASNAVTLNDAVATATGNLALQGGTVSATGSTLTATNGDLTARGTAVTASGSTLTTQTSGNVDLLAGTVTEDGSWTATAGDNTITLANTDITSAGDVKLQAGKIGISTDDNTAAKNIQGTNLLLAASNSYDSEARSYGMGPANTIDVNGTNLSGNRLTLIGYNVNVSGASDIGITTNNIIGAVSTQQVTMDETGNVSSFVKPATEADTNPKLVIDGMVTAYTSGQPININLYGDASFHNTGNSALEAMSFRADSPYSLDIKGELTVTDAQGISLASKSIRIADNLTATNSSIKLSSTGGEMYISGDLRAKDDVIVKSTENIVLTNKEGRDSVTVTSDEGSVNLLAGGFADDNGSLGSWVGGDGTANSIAITNAHISAAEAVDIKGGSISVGGTGSMESERNKVTLVAANGIDAEGAYDVAENNDVSLGGTLSVSNTEIRGRDVKLENGSLNVASGKKADIFAINANVEDYGITGKSFIDVSENATLDSATIDGTTGVQGTTVRVKDSTLKGDNVLNGATTILQGNNVIAGRTTVAGTNAAVTGSLSKEANDEAAASLTISAMNVEVGNDEAGVASVIDQLNATGGTVNVKLSDDAEAVAGKTAVTAEGSSVTISNSKFKSLNAHGTESLDVSSEVMATGDIVLRTKNLALSGKTLNAGEGNIRLTGDETVAVENVNLSSSANAIAGNIVDVSGTSSFADTTAITAGETATLSGTNNFSGNAAIGAEKAVVSGTANVAGKLSINAGDVVLEDAAVTATGDNAEVSITGTSVGLKNVTLGNDVGIVAEQTKLEGSITAAGKMIEASGQMAANNAGLGEGITLSAKGIEMEGGTLGYNNRLVAVDDIVIKDDNVNLGENGAVTLEAGRNISILAEGEDEGSHTVTVTNTTLKANGLAVMAGNEVNFADGNDLSGTVKAEAESVNISGTNTLAGNLTTDGIVNFGGAVLVSGEAGDFAVNGSRVNLSGENTIKGTLDITATDTATVLGTVGKDSGTEATLALRGNTVNIGSGEEGSAVTAIRVDDLSVSDAGTVVVQNAAIDAKTNITEAGTAVLQNMLTAAEVTVDDTDKAVLNNVTLQDAADVNATETDVSGTIAAASQNLSLKGTKVTLHDAGITAGTVSVTAEGEAVLDGVALDTGNDSVTVKAPKAVLKGGINVKELAMDAANVHIGDGIASTVVVANAVTPVNAQNLTIAEADITNANLVTKAADTITLKGQVTAEEKALVLDAPTVQLGDGVTNTVVKAASLSGTPAVEATEGTEGTEGTKILVLNKVNVEGIENLSASAVEKVLLKGRVEAGEKDLNLEAERVQIGDGTPGTAVNAKTVNAKADTVVMDGGGINASSAALQGKTVTLKNNSSIKAYTEEGHISLLAADEDNTDLSYTPWVDEEGNPLLDEEGNLMADATTTRTITLQPENRVIVDASRMEGADISLVGYSVAVQNGSAIYADKSLTALAGKEMKSVDGGALTVTARAAGETEPPNTITQKDSIIMVAGQTWRNFQPYNPPAYSGGDSGSTLDVTPVSPVVPMAQVKVLPVALAPDEGDIFKSSVLARLLYDYTGLGSVTRSIGTFFDEKFGIGGYLLQKRDVFDLAVAPGYGIGTGEVFFNLEQKDAEEEEKDE